MKYSNQEIKDSKLYHKEEQIAHFSNYEADETVNLTQAPDYEEHTDYLSDHKVNDQKYHTNKKALQNKNEYIIKYLPDTSLVLEPRISIWT